MNRGVTLLEILLAMTVLAIALTGVVAAVANGMSAQQANRELHIARDIVMARLDDVRSRPVNQSLATYLAQNATFPVPDLPQASGTVSFSPPTPWPIDSAPPYLVEVQVRVSWIGARGPTHYENYALVTR